MVIEQPIILATPYLSGGANRTLPSFFRCLFKFYYTIHLYQMYKLHLFYNLAAATIKGVAETSHTDLYKLDLLGLAEFSFSKK